MGLAVKMLYVLDTSALIDAWTRWYSPKVLPPFWEGLAELARAGSVTIPEPVLWELSDQEGDDLYRWCRDRVRILVTQVTSAIEGIARDLGRRYPNIRSAGPSSKNYADLFVIATAADFRCAVVTDEAATGNLNGPRLPDVCKAEGIRVIQMHRFPQEQGWQFVRAARA